LTLSAQFDVGAF